MKPTKENGMFLKLTDRYKMQKAYELVSHLRVKIGELSSYIEELEDENNTLKEENISLKGNLDALNAEKNKVVTNYNKIYNENIRGGYVEEKYKKMLEDKNKKISKLREERDKYLNELIKLRNNL